MNKDYQARIEKRKREVICSCGSRFMAADWKRKECDDCKTTCACGAKKTKASKYCTECRKKSPACIEQRKRLHALTRSRQNVSKRPEVREKISQTLKNGAHARYTKKGYLKKLIEQAHTMRQKRGGMRSWVEISVGSLLLGFKPQIRIGPYAVDYANLKNKIAVEVQGCYWHCCPKCFPEGPKYRQQKQNMERDKRKEKFLKAEGWKLLFVWEHEHYTSNSALWEITNRILTYVHTHQRN